ncbi:hypothetical protein CUU63_20310 [Bacillus halotolerans]|uniref:Transmembrane protein n=1 Tax=Bacillus halotolerans TaxID=260554 RepID=A0A9Q6A591_9BACI|nr:hypothetical protein CUU63_20310 [Bacillus halotolerans]
MIHSPQKNSDDRTFFTQYKLFSFVKSVSNPMIPILLAIQHFFKNITNQKKRIIDGKFFLLFRTYSLQKQQTKPYKFEINCYIF